MRVLNANPVEPENLEFIARQGQAGAASDCIIFELWQIR